GGAAGVGCTVPICPTMPTFAELLAVKKTSGSVGCLVQINFRGDSPAGRLKMFVRWPDAALTWTIRPPLGFATPTQRLPSRAKVIPVICSFVASMKVANVLCVDCDGFATLGTTLMTAWLAVSS